MVGWGSTYAAITAGVKRVRKAGKSVAQLHLVHLNPFPRKLGEMLRSYEVVIVPENNLGHLTRLLRSDFLVDAKVMSKVQGSPFRVGDVEHVILRRDRAPRAHEEGQARPNGASRWRRANGAVKAAGGAR